MKPSSPGLHAVSGVTKRCASKLKQPEWEIAAETLLAAVEGSGRLMFAEIAMRKAVSAEKKTRS